MAWTAPTTRSTGDLITASIWNTDLTDNLDYLKTEVDKAILEDGTNTFTANQPMGNFLLTGLGAPTAAGHATRYDEFLGCKITHSANQACANGAFTDLTFDTETYDDDSMHEGITNPSRITCVTAGRYLIIAGVTFAANAVGNRWAAIKYNNTTYIAAQSCFTCTAASTTALTVATIYELSATDYVEVTAWQDSGGALNINSTATYTPYFQANRIGS